MKNSQPSTADLLSRGLGYALTSIFAICTGYFMRTSDIISSDLVLLIIPIALSLPFFLSYAICFHYDGPDRITNKDIFRREQKGASILIFIFGIAVSTIALLVYNVLEDNMPPKILLLSFVLYGVIFIGYSILLNQYYVSGKRLTVRHQLVWPVILSIGVSLYMGMFFDSFITSFKPATPLIVLFSYFIISEKFIVSGKIFLVSGLLFIVSFAVLSVSDLLVHEFFAAFAFSTTISAYLASFESWRVASHVATQIHSETSNSNATLTEDTFANYYFATLSAMVIASLIIPFLYVFTDFGNIFLIGFLLHSITSFVFWYIFGFKKNILRKPNWIRYKIIFGFLFLIIMAIDSYSNSQPNKPYMPNLVTYSGLSVLIVIASILGSVFYKKNKTILTDENNKLPVLKRLFADRENFILIIGPLSTVMCFLLLLIKDSQSVPAVNNKINFAFLVYLFCIGISAFTMLIKYFWFNNNSGNKKMVRLDSITTALLGFFLTTRIVTSSLVGLAVFLPSLINGHGTLESFLSCLPFVLACMGGFALNDYFDYRKDVINYPNRAIPSKKLSLKSVLVLSILILVVSSVVSVVKSNSYVEFSIYISAIIGVVLYNFVVHKLGYLKNLFTAILCVLPIVYDLVIYDFNDIFVLLPISLMLFVLGRELLMDVHDIGGDLQGGFKTLPMVLGERRSSKIGLCIQLLGVFLMLPIIIYEPSLWKGILWTIMLLFMMAVCLYWWKVSNRQRLAIIRLMRIPLLFSLLILIV